MRVIERDQRVNDEDKTRQVVKTVWRFLEMNKSRILTKVWWGLALGIVIGCTYNYHRGLSGYDWSVFYVTQGKQIDPEKLNNPMWVYLILTPISYLPSQMGYFIFLMLNICMLWIGSQLTKCHRFLLLLSFPTFWLLWFGQLDGFVLLGVALGLWSVQNKKPIGVGVSVLLLLVKPHIGGPLAMIYLLKSFKRATLAVVGFGFLISLIIWGWEWPLLLINRLTSATRVEFIIQQTNISLYPWGLLAWLTLLIPMPLTERAITVMSAALLSVPYAATYSILSLLVLPVPWWVYLISSTPFVLGPDGYWVTVLAPLGCIVWVVTKYAATLSKSRHVPP